MNQSAPPVTVHFASYNTRRVSELCIRSMRALAAYPFDLIVGDCGSNDGSIEMFKRYEARQLLTLEVASNGRKHGEWLDQWFASTNSRYAIFCDSDVEFLQRGWLARLVQTAQDTGAALVATRIQAESGVAFVHPITGAAATLAPRPEPWLMLIDVTQTRHRVSASFLYEEQTLADGTKIAFDTAAAFFREFKAAGLKFVEMPSDFSSSFRHYSGMTWQRRGVSMQRRVKQFAKHATVWLRLARSRVVHQSALSTQQ